MKTWWQYYKGSNMDWRKLRISRGMVISFLLINRIITFHATFYSIITHKRNDENYQKYITVIIFFYVFKMFSPFYSQILITVSNRNFFSTKSIISYGYVCFFIHKKTALILLHMCTLILLHMCTYLHVSVFIMLLLI